MSQQSQKRQVEANAAYRAAKRTLERRECKDPARRTRLEKSTEGWLRFYLENAFPKPFGDVHRPMIESAEKAFKQGGKNLNIAPRGTGKTTVFAGYTLKLALTGQAPFPAYLPWDAKGVKKMLRFWKNALCFNERIAADYPEVAVPFVASRGSSQKCNSLVWEDTGKETGARIAVSDGMIVFPDSLGVIGSATINGNPRGLNHTTPDGRVLRPSFALVDDAQSKEVAKSPRQVQDTIEVIDTDVAGMAGPDKRMPIFLLGTVICRDDVVDRYAKSRDWHCVRIPQVVKWPEATDLWDKFGELIKDRKEDEALAYYNENRMVLDKGGEVSWEERYDSGRGEPNALYSAMRDYYFMGASAFMAERQGEPLDVVTSQYVITPEIICEKAIETPRLHLPDDSTVFGGHVDVNRAGLHWCLTAFNQQMTGHVVAYGKHAGPNGRELWEKNAPDQTRKTAIFRALATLFGELGNAKIYHRGAAIMPGLMLVDAGYESRTVHRFVEVTRLPFPLRPAIGRAAQKYRVSPSCLIGRPMEECHVQRPNDARCPYVMFNADYWREIAQRAFLGAVGEPGGCTLHAVKNKKAHVPFAEHVVAERLAQKYATEYGWRWEWVHRPGTHWDWCEALTGSWGAAALLGLSSTGAPQVRRKKKKRNVSVTMAKV